MKRRKYVFVSYGDKSYRHSIERLRQQALSLNIFDKVLIISEKDLPPILLGIRCLNIIGAEDIGCGNHGVAYRL